jgi:acetylornithine deacetylase
MHQIDNTDTRGLYNDAVQLLKQLIATPSFSKEEDGTASIIESFFHAKDIKTTRLVNNVWAVNKHYDAAKPTILLNSHHDTVKSNKDYTNDPFSPMEQDDKLYGLGSNDAGGCLVSLIGAFLYFQERADLEYNLLIAASAEEEISGSNGIEALLPTLRNIDFAIVGEPTLMDMAVAEKGLMVIDCAVHGKSGHAAREEDENAIYKAIADIEWFKSYAFPKVSPLLGPVKMSVTIINAGTQHNVVPATCNFVVDIRINDCYTHEEILEIIQQHVTCDVKARSTRLRSTSIDVEHPIIRAGLTLGLKPYGSATLSDKALMPFPALKIGPGDSARSHMANEFIYLSEIKQGINTYIQLLNEIL